jgi:predicted ATPase/tRNA A-37 threonylcarbamoyl transferase component Bud32
MGDLPAKLGGYQVERELGRGGMGVVYLARDPRLHRSVAIKALNDELGEHPDRLARFEREARTLAALNHANIAAVFGLVEELGRQLLVMEYVEGQHLGEHIKGRGALPPEDAASVCVQIAAGLEAAHEIGVVHRDLKPANVRVRPDGAVKLLDFGLAKPEQEMRRALGDSAETMSMAPTAEGRIMGTAGYMSPEQARGRPVDKRADIWSFGAVLFECLAGHRAFKGDTPMDALVAILEKDPPWDLLPAQTPERMRSLIARCLEKDARKRLRDIGDARIDLEELLGGRATGRWRPPADPVGAGAFLPGGAPGGRARAAYPPSGTGTRTSGSASRMPSPLTSFVGREDDLEAIRGLLGEARLLTLTGPGGCGKSRLAVEAARRIDGEYRDGAWCVDLAGVTDAGLVSGEVAAMLGVVEAEGRATVDVLIDALAGREMVLVLDNGESVCAGVGAVSASLLASCPGLRVIATTREPLRHEGEWVYRVGTLGVPDARVVDADEIAGFEAVRLFIDRARAVRPEFVLTEAVAADVAEICRKLDGVPLAIELAAARMKSLVPAQIAERLEDRFRLLRSRGGDPRQQTLLATIEWSFDQLDKIERAALTRLSVFRDGATLEAAEAVLPAGDADGVEIEDWEVLDLIEQLIDRSLVTVVEPGGDGPSGETRYRVLESIRQFGAERLHGSGDEAAVRSAQLAWVARLATRAESQLVGRDQKAWFERLEQEHENIRACLEHIADAGGPDPETLELGRSIGAGAWRFWAYAGHISEGKRALLRLDRLGEGGEPTASWARLRGGVASIATITGDLGQAVAFAVAGLDMARESGDQRTIAQLLECLGWACLRDLLVGRAADHFEESEEIRRGLGDRVLRAVSVCGLAGCARASGGRDRARVLYDRAEEILRGAGDGLQVAAVEFGRGLLALGEGDADGAAVSLRKASRLQVAIGATTELPAMVEALACLAELRGQHEKAVRLFASAAAGRGRIGCPLCRLEDEEFAPFRERAGSEAEDLEALRAEGASMRLRRAVRYGLGES